MLIINDLSLRIAGRLLLDHASVTLPSGSKAGLVGRNGTGKTTLFRAIGGDISAETGTISLPRNVRIGQVAQEAPGTEEPLIDIVKSDATAMPPSSVITCLITISRPVSVPGQYV